MTGTIVSLPEQRPGRVRFRFLVDAVEGPYGSAPPEVPRTRVPVPGDRLQVSWYGAPGPGTAGGGGTGAPARASPSHPGGGERWRLPLRVRMLSGEPRGEASPGRARLRRWAFRERLDGFAWVRRPGDARRLPDPFSPPSALTRLRQGLLERVRALDPEGSERALLEALTLGVRDGFTKERWDVLRATGTSHLVAISGLHVSLVAALLFGFGRALGLLARLAGLPRASPRRLGVGLAIAGAIAYSALAGFSIPTVRALIMVTTALLWLGTGRRGTPSHGLCLALVVVLATDPRSVYGPGFWLSFGAVALLLYMVAARAHPPSGWRRIVFVQGGLSLGLAPALLLFFGSLPLVSPLANLLASPWVGLLVVPLALGGVAAAALPWQWTEWASGLLLAFAETLLHRAWLALEQMARWVPELSLATAPGVLAIVAAVPGVLVLLAPRGIPMRFMTNSTGRHPRATASLPRPRLEASPPGWGSMRPTGRPMGYHPPPEGKDREPGSVPPGGARAGGGACGPAGTEAVRLLPVERVEEDRACWSSCRRGAGSWFPSCCARWWRSPSSWSARGH